MSENILEEVINYVPVVVSSLGEITDLDVSCESIILKFLSDPNKIDSSGVVQIQAVIDYMHERMNIGNWREVPLYIRKTLTIATYLRLLSHVKLATDVGEEMLKEYFKIVDFGLLFGAPLDKEPMLLQKCSACVSSLYNSKPINTPIDVNERKEPEYDFKKLNYISLDVISCPSMESFYRDYILPDKPVILDNCMKHWPALQKWKDPNYFINVAGPRTVPIEIGKQYTDSNWTQKLVTVEEFINTYIYEKIGIAYLAQYQLFHHIPELKRDIIEPEYCCFSDSNEPVDVMAWFGPKGTVSPLHHDQKKNLLSQVVGQKLIFLMSPDDSKFLYPHESELLHNTSKVDPRNPDYDTYPEFKNAKTYYCTLKEGQMLYIPPKWWHFVESLSVSFSVSFWWS
ncbi:bifunctional peptidase and arginyl-hydroxylase JMJD5 [Aricia agestis]|uniref:bifunctional peptidase and arginyl-hydroxylase JMJD5 n=1 Tax=Aricia agestis TaxID=91739 RepID=UPI001C20B7EF|nr:bifunctional peptidase and arginyl-hydroxylase JMJD5 [Aricia agestis]